jgi:site-specific DNA recombinase
MKTIGYVRVSSDKQADRGVSLEAQAEKIRAMAVVHNAELLDIIVDGGESAKSLNRPGMERLLALVDAGEVQTVIIAKLDRLTRSVKDLCTLLERFTKRGVALVSVPRGWLSSPLCGAVATTRGRTGERDEQV